MPKRIVDTLEAIDINVEKRERLALVCSCPALLQLGPEKHSVWQTEQRVIMGEMRDPSVGNAALRLVIEHVNDIPRLLRSEADRPQPHDFVSVTKRHDRCASSR
jgi:hypothetical protein